MSSARELVARLELQPHPEGGWYRETWRAPSAAGERAACTAIHFLLESGQRSHWHRVDAAEIWCWHGGDPLRLSMAEASGTQVTHSILGGNPVTGNEVQAVVPPHWWQAAELQAGGDAGYALVSCIVAPGFEFAGFELAPPGWSPEDRPDV